MKLLELVPCLGKAVRLVDPTGVERHFPAPITAKEISALYPGHQVRDDSSITVQINEQLQSGKTYSLMPISEELEPEFRTQIQHKNSRKSQQNIMSNSPDFRRLRSGTAKQWKPSLDVILENSVVCVVENEERARSVKKSAGNVRRKVKKVHGFSVKDEFRHAAGVPTGIPTFSPMTFMF